jgi:hypothetical protein
MLEFIAVAAFLTALVTFGTLACRALLRGLPAHLDAERPDNHQAQQDLEVCKAIQAVTNETMGRKHG